MDNELVKMLISEIEERDNMIKNMVENLSKITDAYIIKDKEKDKRHTRTIIFILLLTIGFVSFFTGSYFWSSYNDHSTTTITGDGNSSSNVSGNDNTTNQK